MTDIINIVEVGPRDGLQSEHVVLSTEQKYQFIQQLVDCGLKTVEATSFVSAEKIPQLGDHRALMQRLSAEPTARYPVLVPNLTGYQAAIAAGSRQVAFFTAASETFCQHNINCGVTESLERLAEFLPLAKTGKIPVRAYISCLFHCPYEGKIPASRVIALAERLYAMGVDEIALGDTTGVGTPGQCIDIFRSLASTLPPSAVAAHFHNTYHQALANVFAILPLGYRTFDSAVAGLGGCPSAPGASGNLATEDLVFGLLGSGFKTGIDLGKLLAAGRAICQKLRISPRSQLAQRGDIEFDLIN